MLCQSVLDTGGEVAVLRPQIIFHVRELSLTVVTFYTEGPPQAGSFCLFYRAEEVAVCVGLNAPWFNELRGKPIWQRIGYPHKSSCWKLKMLDSHWSRVRSDFCDEIVLKSQRRHITVNRSTPTMPKWSRNVPFREITMPYQRKKE